MKGLYQSENQWGDNFRSPKMAPAFRAEAACGLALSSLAPWEVKTTPGGRTTYTCRACVGLWKPGLGGSRQITLFGKVDPSTLVKDLKGMPAASASTPPPVVDGPSGLPLPGGLEDPRSHTPFQIISMDDGSKALAIQLEMDEPPGKEMNSYTQSKVAFQKRFKGSEPLRDVPLHSGLKVSKRIKLTGEACQTMWKLLLKHPEGEALKKLEKIAREAEAKRKRQRAVTGH